MEIPQQKPGLVRKFWTMLCTVRPWMLMVEKSSRGSVPYMLLHLEHERFLRKQQTWRTTRPDNFHLTGPSAVSVKIFWVANFVGRVWAIQFCHLSSSPNVWGNTFFEALNMLKPPNPNKANSCKLPFTSISYGPGFLSESFVGHPQMKKTHWPINVFRTRPRRKGRQMVAYSSILRFHRAGCLGWYPSAASTNVVCFLVANSCNRWRLNTSHYQEYYYWCHTLADAGCLLSCTFIQNAPTETSGACNISCAQHCNHHTQLKSTAWSAGELSSSPASK